MSNDEHVPPAARPKRTTDADLNLGSRIAKLRSARGLSQTTLASALGVSFQQVQKYEAGRNRIGAGRLQAIADRLGVPVSVFFTDETDASVSQPDHLRYLHLAGALELLQAYESINDERMRRSILDLAQSAARLTQAAGTDEI